MSVQISEHCKEKVSQSGSQTLLDMIEKMKSFEEIQKDLFDFSTFMDRPISRLDRDFPFVLEEFIDSHPHNIMSELMPSILPEIKYFGSYLKIDPKRITQSLETVQYSYIYEILKYLPMTHDAEQITVAKSFIRELLKEWYETKISEFKDCYYYLIRHLYEYISQINKQLY